MVVIAKYQAVLEKLGLTTLAQVKQFKGDLVKDHRGRRDIFKIVATNSDGGTLVLFLKRNWKPYKKDGITSLLRRGSVWSLSRQEWENSLLLGKVGLQTAGLVAYGEARGLLWEKFSFLVTEAATGGQTMGDFVRTCPDRAERRRVLDALAREIRRMHDAGLATPDLFCRHVFVETANEPPRFCLIDMARLDHRKQMSAALRARDLAALNITAPLRFVSARERLRFLQIYSGQRRERKLAELIRKRVTYLLKRRKFRDFTAR